MVESNKNPEENFSKKHLSRELIAYIASSYKVADSVSNYSKYFDLKPEVLVCNSSQLDQDGQERDRRTFLQNAQCS